MANLYYKTRLLDECSQKQWQIIVKIVESSACQPAVESAEEQWLGYAAALFVGTAECVQGI